MIIDCQTCEVREIHCADCVVTALLGHEPVFEDLPSDLLDLDAAEQTALGVLAESGLVSPLRLVSARYPVQASPQPVDPVRPRRHGGVQRVG
jgi:hypothetical protein